MNYPVLLSMTKRAGDTQLHSPYAHKWKTYGGRLPREIAKASEYGTRIGLGNPGGVPSMVEGGGKYDLWGALTRPLVREIPSPGDEAAYRGNTDGGRILIPSQPVEHAPRNPAELRSRLRPPGLRAAGTNSRDLAGYNGFPTRMTTTPAELRGHEMTHVWTAPTEGLQRRQQFELAGVPALREPGVARYQFDPVRPEEMNPPMSAIQEWSWNSRGRRYESPGEFERDWPQMLRSLEGLPPEGAERLMRSQQLDYPMDMRRLIHSLRDVQDPKVREQIMRIYSLLLPAHVSAPATDSRTARLS
jgi:hypothetical protein